MENTNANLDRHTVAVATMETPLTDITSLGSTDDQTTMDHHFEELLMEQLGKESVNVLFSGLLDAGTSTLKKTVIELSNHAEQQSGDSIGTLSKHAAELKKSETADRDRVHFETEIRHYIILAPLGPKTYKPNTVLEIDVVVCVVSAIEDESEENFEKYYNIRDITTYAADINICKIIVAVNKMDHPTVGWSKERYDKIIKELSSFFSNKRYGSAIEVVFIPISGYARANIKDRVDSGDCDWYTGSTLLDCLDSTRLRERNRNAPLRVSIREKDQDMEAAMVGKVETGFITKGMQVLAMPKGNIVKIESIMNEFEQEIPIAGPGIDVRLLVSGNIKEASGGVMPGSVLCCSKYPVSVVSKFIAEIKVLDGRHLVCEGFNAILIIHTVPVEMTITKMLHVLEKNTNRRSKKPPLFLKTSQRGIVIIETEELICAETFASSSRMGLFTIKDEGRTIASGRIKELLKDEGGGQGETSRSE
ncbi:translation termination factor GTPase eRF3 [Entomortierella lignicola]|nr:translation termination factor GTPase eRF3 [Entomortierella lignicola]